ncbi:RagB/SusD family nutrient uptake outer membrane protein [Fulvivirgaceae bacterium BMA12]|uniref:RagB/SusD family nutrient uptake outer membrane protein n=1 Tax=Agaribacillus aureus TaxID=3051825 RepID=A0ABT8LG64_9BACT|nr:RagB/SusD family nutrient uptake outer membrane protein [Fulvivirgaceae bacterium BMA12]
MKNIKKLLATTVAGALIILLANSCGEDFVTKEFTNGVTDENFFKNESDALQALTAVYDIVSASGLYLEAAEVLGDCPSDDILELTGDNGDFGPHFKAASDFRFLPNNRFSMARWFDAYKGVFRANILLDRLPDIEMDQAIKNRIEGETKFLRALFYFNLVVTFGDVPFTTDVLTREEYNELARTDRNIIYGQMEQDLRDAAGFLPEDASDPVGRATRGAANGLLSRVYLYQSKWSEAANTAKSVMDQNTYQLVAGEDFHKLFSGQLENSSESLFEMQSVSNAPNFWSGSTENHRSIHWSPVIGWANWFSPSPGAYDQFQAEPADVRRSGSILHVGAVPTDMIDTDGDGVQEPFPSGDMNSSYFHDNQCRKWLPEGQPMSSGNSFNVNFTILRYAEVLLNYAEAQNELGNSTEALSAVNQIRSRAQVPDLTETNQGLLRDLIRSERRKELLFEGQRYFDIQRWGIAEQVLGPLGYETGRHEFWPVPVSELDLMPNLTQYPE